MAGICWSVVVPVRGQSKNLGKLVAAMERQTLSAGEWEMLVVDDGSTEPVRLPPGDKIPVKVIRQQPAGPGPARNRGVAAAQGEWVAFTAADCEPAPDWLSCLEQAALHSPRAALGGTVRCGLPRSSTAMTSHLVVEHLASRLNRDPRDAQFFTPNNFAVPAESFRSMGGFGTDYGLGTGEDRDFCARWRASGRRIVAAPEAVVVHTHPLSLAGLLRQQYLYGRGSGIYRRLRQSAGAPVPFENMDFYLGALLAPWRTPTVCDNPWVLAVLIGASQAVNAAGLIRELAADVTPLRGLREVSSAKPPAK